jgi:endonuclease/exonuclease/phosphatase family metal-dependent hydrolase
MHQHLIVFAVDCIKRSVKLGTYNVRTCSQGKEGIVELGLLAHELEGVSVGLCGLQKLHWPSKGECDVYAQPNGSTRLWKLVWFGRDAQHAEQGVGLLMAPEWANDLFFFDQHNPRLISARFRAKARQHLTVFSTYSPIDYKDGVIEEEVEKQSFYNLLFACLKQVPASDKLVVLGDFNAELGSN